MNKNNNHIDKESILKLNGPIVIIGASGFVGANLFKCINKHRNDVFACIHKNKGWRLDEISNKNIIKVDINSKKSIINMAEKIKPKVIFNCTSYGAYSFEKEISQIINT